MDALDGILLVHGYCIYSMQVQSWPYNCRIEEKFQRTVTINSEVLGDGGVLGLLRYSAEVFCIFCNLVCHVLTWLDR